jgi:hypothetical protein
MWQWPLESLASVVVRTYPKWFDRAVVSQRAAEECFDLIKLYVSLLVARLYEVNTSSTAKVPVDLEFNFQKC